MDLPTYEDVAAAARRIEGAERRSESRRMKKGRGLWQRRYWEHVIRDTEDYRRHADYIHFNPVKHGYVSAPRLWPFFVSAMGTARAISGELGCARINLQGSWVDEANPAYSSWYGINFSWRSQGARKSRWHSAKLRGSMRPLFEEEPESPKLRYEKDPNEVRSKPWVMISKVS